MTEVPPETAKDRIAFMRVCSGKFERDMSVHHSRSGKKVRLSSSHKLFGNERETLNEAYPGDVIGLVGHDSFGAAQANVAAKTPLEQQYGECKKTAAVLAA